MKFAKISFCQYDFSAFQKGKKGIKSLLAPKIITRTFKENPKKAIALQSEPRHESSFEFEKATGIQIYCRQMQMHCIYCICVSNILVYKNSPENFALVLGWALGPTAGQKKRKEAMKFD